MTRKTSPRFSKDHHTIARAMATDDLSLLSDRVRQALSADEQVLAQLRRFDDEYADLQRVVRELPEKTSHDIMVPFTDVAFFPGRLIHTNELTVLLGSDLYAERSASQTLEIIERRREMLREKIRGADAGVDAMGARLGALDAVAAADGDGASTSGGGAFATRKEGRAFLTSKPDGTVEITESYEHDEPLDAFDDGARKFVGREKFESYAYVRENVANARCAVESMRMEGLDRAIIRWRLEGDVPGGRAVVNGATALELNLITGRAVRCEETWDASESDAAAASFLSSSRAAYATPMNVKDAADDAMAKMADMLKLGDEGAGGMEDVQVDPNDPMKFFTESNKPEDDYLQYALFVAALWLVYEGLKATATLH